MNKKQTFTRHQNTERMPGTKLKTIPNKNNVMLVYLLLFG